MAFSHTNSKGQQYFLHMKDVTLKGGRLQRIYYFAKLPNHPKGTPVDELPVGRIVVENLRTGLPVLKKDVALGAAA
ncbi:MAG TPA: hypothetical protein VLI05_06540 [Candidatus Saccharimonadia bacterium]|nr:hypothetical protein [Candidatus Saccharimonadia bacterium]